MGARVQDAELQRALRNVFGKQLCYGEILQRGQMAAMQTRSEYTRAPNRQQAQLRQALLRDACNEEDEAEDEAGPLQRASSGNVHPDRPSADSKDTLARKQQLGMYSVDLSAAARSGRTSYAGGQPVSLTPDACKSTPSVGHVNTGNGGGGIRINFLFKSSSSDLTSPSSATGSQSAQASPALQSSTSTLLTALPGSGHGMMYRRSTNSSSSSIATFLAAANGPAPLRPSMSGATVSAQPTPRPSSTGLTLLPPAASGSFTLEQCFPERSGSSSWVAPAGPSMPSTPSRPRGMSYSGVGPVPRISSAQASKRPELLLHQILASKEARVATAATAPAQAAGEDQLTPLYQHRPSSAANKTVPPLRSRSTDFAQLSLQGQQQPQPHIPQGSGRPLVARPNPRLRLQAVHQEGTQGLSQPTLVPTSSAAL